MTVDDGQAGVAPHPDQESGDRRARAVTPTLQRQDVPARRPSAAGGTLASKLRGVSAEHVLRVLLPAIALIALLAVANQVPVWFNIPPYELPTLTESWNALVANWPGPAGIGVNYKITLADALVGFGVGNLLAIIGAILFSQSRYVEWTFFPLAILIQTIPIIVVAPLMVNLLSAFGPRLPGGSGFWDPSSSLPLIGVGTKPILAVTVLITFFPTLVNMTVGLRSIDANLYDFMRLMNASRWTILWRLRIPSAIPYMFASFKITSTLCFVGAIVGEWMLAAQSGIGGLFNIFAFEDNKPALWACVIVVSLSSMAFFAFVVVAERILVPWREQR